MDGRHKAPDLSLYDREEPGYSVAAPLLDLEPGLPYNEYTDDLDDSRVVPRVVVWRSPAAVLLDAYRGQGGEEDVVVRRAEEGVVEEGDEEVEAGPVGPLRGRVWPSGGEQGGPEGGEGCLLARGQPVRGPVVVRPGLGVEEVGYDALLEVSVPLDRTRLEPAVEQLVRLLANRLTVDLEEDGGACGLVHACGLGCLDRTAGALPR